MENLFYDYGVKSDLFPKCLKFFIEFAKNADIALSSRLTKKHHEPRARSITSSQTKKINKLFKAHREANWEECRWCFAIDLQRVKAKEIAKYDFPDATILSMKCDRCGGEYSYYFRVRGEDYIKERMIALHPDIQGHVTDDKIRAINHRLWPGDDGDC
jgi:hypothetical protein